MTAKRPTRSKRAAGTATPPAPETGMAPATAQEVTPPRRRAPNVQGRDVVKLDGDFITRAANLVSTGNYDVVVCRMLGVARGSWSAWLSIGKKRLEEGGDDGDGTPYRKFYETVLRARAQSQAIVVSKIFEAATKGFEAQYIDVEEERIMPSGVVRKIHRKQVLRPGTPPDWRAGIAFLERRFPELWEVLAKVPEGVKARAEASLIEAVAENLRRSGAITAAQVDAEPAKALGLKNDAEIREFGRELAKRMTDVLRGGTATATPPAGTVLAADGATVETAAKGALPEP